MKKRNSLKLQKQNNAVLNKIIMIINGRQFNHWKYVNTKEIELYTYKHTHTHTHVDVDIL